jgi:hypothetical protein
MSAFNPASDPHYHELVQDFLSMYSKEELSKEPHVEKYIGKFKFDSRGATCPVGSMVF